MEDAFQSRKIDLDVVKQNKTFAIQSRIMPSQKYRPGHIVGKMPLFVIFAEKGQF